MDNITKIERNDPYPCGSEKIQTVLPQRTGKVRCTTTRRSSLASSRSCFRRSSHCLLKFSHSCYGPSGLQEAWDEFMDWQDIPFESDTPHMPISIPWFFYDWLPDIDTEVFADTHAMAHITLG